MGKKKKPVRLDVVEGALIAALFGIIGWFIVMFVDGIRDDIANNSAVVTEMRLNMARVHPDLGFAAYAASTSEKQETLTPQEARTVFEALASHNYADETEAAYGEVRDTLDNIGLLDERQVDLVAASYFELAGRKSETWTETELETILEGLHLATGVLGASAARLDRVSFHADRRSGLALGAFVLFLVLLVAFIGRLVFGYLSDDDTDEEYEVREEIRTDRS